MECEHFWVERKDGYEEQCGPAICLICGEYGCECKFRRQIENLSEIEKKRRWKLFEELGIDGNKHHIEESLAE